MKEWGEGEEIMLEIQKYPYSSISRFPESHASSSISDILLLFTYLKGRKFKMQNQKFLECIVNII